MNEEEKLMWDWLCGDADAWTKYAKEKNDAQKNDNEHAGVSDKFNTVSNRIELFLNKHNRNVNKRRYILTEREIRLLRKKYEHDHKSRKSDC